MYKIEIKFQAVSFKSLQLNYDKLRFSRENLLDIIRIMVRKTTYNQLEANYNRILAKYTQDWCLISPYNWIRQRRQLKVKR